MKTTKIVSFLIKSFIIVSLSNYGLSQYVSSNKPFDQTIFFWIFIYIPLYAGYEVLISLTITSLSKNNTSKNQE